MYVVGSGYDTIECLPLEYIKADKKFLEKIFLVQQLHMNFY